MGAVYSIFGLILETKRPFWVRICVCNYVSAARLWPISTQLTLQRPLNIVSIWQRVLLEDGDFTATNLKDWSWVPIVAWVYFHKSVAAARFCLHLTTIFEHRCVANRCLFRRDSARVVSLTLVDCKCRHRLVLCYPESSVNNRLLSRLRGYFIAWLSKAGSHTWVNWRFNRLTWLTWLYLLLELSQLLVYGWSSIELSCQ